MHAAPRKITAKKIRLGDWPACLRNAFVVMYKFGPVFEVWNRRESLLQIERDAVHVLLVSADVHAQAVPATGHVLRAQVEDVATVPADGRIKAEIRVRIAIAGIDDRRRGAVLKTNHLARLH